MTANRWRPMESAPRNGTLVELRLDGAVIMEAAWDGNFLDCDGNDCGCWVARSDPYPVSWTDGVCWQENEDDVPSAQPVGWRPVQGAKP